MHFRREPWCQQICFRGLGANSERIRSLPALSWLTFSLQFCSWQKPSQLSKNCLQISGIKILVWEINISNTLCFQSDSYKININVLSKSTEGRHFFSLTNFNQDDLGRCRCYQRQQRICKDLIHTYQIGKSET